MGTGAGRKVTRVIQWDWAENSLRPTRDCIWRPAPSSGMFLHRRVAVQASDGIKPESHYFSNPLWGCCLHRRICARAQGSSCLLCLARRRGAIYTSLTSLDLGSETRNYSVLTRDRQTDRQLPWCAHWKAEVFPQQPQERGRCI